MLLQHFDAGFVSRARTLPIDLLVVHESVTIDPGCSDRTIEILKSKGFGAQLIIDATGGVVQLAPLNRVVSHAGTLNGRSLGIEIVNPYYPTAGGTAPEPWSQVIDAPWAHKGRYVMPLPDQLEALWQLLCYLERTLPLPLTWPGLVNGRFCMGRLEGADNAAGVQAHIYTAHADGAVPVLYAWLRSRGLEPPEAYDTVLRLARRARAWADVSVYATPPATSLPAPRGGL